ncbi:MAG: hypothetical protein BAJALOKI1v1_850007 [Promethearchaeota archaeon]|nr:MAG: hypothetical protein BAJALOKI1v1_850007 [Candidatus Lokiarchaeota archaeon]
MSYIQKLSEFDFILTVYVKPNSYQQKIEEDGKFLAISLKSKAKKNKANRELVKLLQSKLHLSSTQIQFLSGLTSQDKQLKLTFLDKITERELKEYLLS